MAFGSVYIFNLYTQAGKLSLNDQGSIGTVAAPSKGSAAPFYAPPQLAPAVGRTNLHLGQLDSPLFVNAGGAGEVNTLAINYGGQAWKASIEIPDPPDPNLESDLWLYLAYQKAFLFDATNGKLIPAPGGKASFALTKEE